MKLIQLVSEVREQEVRRRLPWLGLLALAGVVGCGSSNASSVGSVYEVKGKVLLASGKPLDGGQIYFIRDDAMSSSTGKIAGDGTFSLTTGSAGEGAPAGSYKVRIEPVAAPPTNSKRHAAVKLPFASKYLDEDSSELRATVASGPNQLEPFRLTGK